MTLYRSPHYDALSFPALWRFIVPLIMTLSPSIVILNGGKNAVWESREAATWHGVKNLLPHFPLLIPDKEKRKRSPVSLISFRTTYCSADLCKFPGRHRFSPEHRRLPAHRFLRWDRAVRFHPAADYLRHHTRQNRQLPRLQSVPRQVLFSST